MFDRPDNEVKLSHFMHEKTAANFGEVQVDSMVYEVEAEREYVNKLKVQREKVHLYPSRLRDCIPNMIFC